MTLADCAEDVKQKAIVTCQEMISEEGEPRKTEKKMVLDACLSLSCISARHLVA